MGIYKGGNLVMGGVTAVNEEAMKAVAKEEAEEVISTNTTLKVYYDTVKIDLSLVVPADSTTSLGNIETYVPSDRKLLAILGCDIWSYSNDVVPTVVHNATLRFKNLRSSNITIVTLVVPYLYTTA